MFIQTSFLGASVTSYTSSVGWNQESSTVTVNLVEDPDLRQRFTRPLCGTPANFEFGGFKFGGLVQRWLEKRGTDGNPVFEVTLTDPREILDGAKVIISSYRGTIGSFPNLLNAYGYWESKLGFGGSLVNESGMVWNAPFDILKLDTKAGGGIEITPAGPVGIMPAIHTITKERNEFGGPLLYMGQEYEVDLSALPVPPAYYRVGGVSISILELVNMICEDGGHDYICYLEGNIIRFKCVSRVRQPDPGQIANFIYGRDDASSKAVGYELRNDITNAVILGGDVTQLVQEVNIGGGEAIWPFWGFDIKGDVIMGEGKPEKIHKFKLNASPIADIIGDLFYPCTIAELRCAMMDYDSWAAYVMKWEPKKADVINLIGAIDTSSDLAELFPETIFQRDLIDDGEDAAKKFGEMNDNDFWTQRAQRVYEFVRQFSTEYFGKKFLVRIPFFIYWKFEPETTHKISSDEPCDAGYVPDGSMPLGLEFLNEDTFLSPDGRFQCFVKFTNAVLADVQKLPPESVVIQGTDIYMRATIDADVGIVYPNGSLFPYVVVTLDTPVYEMADCPLGKIADVAALLDYQAAELLQEYAAGLRFDSFPVKVAPSPYRPDAVALPLKSNRDSYGPWFTSGGVAGKVSFERDEGLVPWNYGDFDTMNLAALAKLANAATNMQYTETGTVQIAGTPEHSLGDELVSGGPQLTGIDVNIGDSGVTTTYRMQTFTPMLGQFTKNNADRLRRLGLAAQDMRRAVRSLFQRQAALNRLVTSAQIGFMANTSRAVRQQTPHQALFATMSFDKKYGYRTQAATVTVPELVANCRGDKDSVWAATAAMTLEGLLRPFSTKMDRDPTDLRNDMPHYETVQYIDLVPSRAELDPFATDNDIDMMAWGDKYKGMHTKKRDVDYSNARLIGLRGPMVMVGWGYTFTGKPVPNANTTDDNGNPLPEHEWTDEFISNHRKHPESWKAGPIGLYWDSWRKMWTIPTILLGTMDEDVSGDTVEGYKMKIDFLNENPVDRVMVHPWLGGDIKKDDKVCVAYYQQENRWYIISAQCRVGV